MTIARNADDLVALINERLDIPKEDEYLIDYAYGGVRLQKREGRGVRNISPRMTRPELENFLEGVLIGIDYLSPEKRS